MKFCKFCGKEISDDAEFCRHCGKSLISAADTALRHEAAPQPVQKPEPVRPTYAAEPKPEPKKKKGGADKVIVILVLVAVLAIVGVIVWNNLHTNTPPVNNNTPAATSTSSSSSSSSSPSSSSAPLAKGEDGFGWVNADNPASSKPSSAKSINDYASVRGDWKCVFIFDPSGESNTRTRDYGTISLNGPEGNFAVIITWDYYDDGYEKVDQSYAENTVLNGSWSSGKLGGSGDCTINVTFFTAGNTKYGVGTFEAATGAKGTVALYME